MDQKAFKKAEIVTSSTPVKSNQKIVIESPVNSREVNSILEKQI